MKVEEETDKNKKMKFCSKEVLTLGGMYGVLSYLCRYTFEFLGSILFWGFFFCLVLLTLDIVPPFIKIVQKKYPRISVYLQCYGVFTYLMLFLFIILFLFDYFASEGLKKTLVESEWMSVLPTVIVGMSIISIIVPFFAATYIVFVKKEKKV